MTLTWQDVLSVISFLIGLVGIVSYLDQRRSAQSQRRWEEFVRRNVDKSITEEQIAELSKQRQTLEVEVREQVPKLARTIVLTWQLEAHRKALLEHYGEWARLKEEVHLEPGHELDENIQRTITDQLLPDYQRGKQKEALKEELFVLSLAFAAGSLFLPAGLDALFRYVIGLRSALLIARLLVANAKTPAEERRVIRIAGWAAFLIGLTAVTYGALILSFSSLPNHDRVVELLWCTGIGTLGAGILGISLVPLRRGERRILAGLGAVIGTLVLTGAAALAMEIGSAAYRHTRIGSSDAIAGFLILVGLAILLANAWIRIWLERQILPPSSRLPVGAVTNQAP